tara:strand:- start:51 stop:425 length:375 start_codon:yes stop_codon:yes gene_type:complete
MKIAKKINIDLMGYKERLQNKVKNSVHIFYCNKLMPFSTFFLDLPQSFKKIMHELEELHEIELFDRLFLIKKSERELIKINNLSDKSLSRLSKYFFGLKNSSKIVLNKKIIQIFYSKSNPLRLK